MNAYIVNIFILILLGILLLWYKPSYKSRLVFCVIATILWIILSGLRHLSIGADTYSYKISFEAIKNRSWSSLWDNFINILVKGAKGKDPGYSFFEKFIQLFTSNYQIYLMTIAMIFTISLGVWIYRNSSEPLISYLIYSCLFYSFFAITGHRQTIATAMVVLIGYKFIKERRFLPFLLLVMIAFTIHKSALAFFPFYFLANKKISKNYLIAILSIFPLLMYFRVPVAIFFQKISGYEYGIYEGAGTLNFTILLLLVAIVALWKSKTILANNSQATHFYNALIISVLATPLTWVNPSAMRVVQYYSIYLILLLPAIVNSFKKDERLIVNFVVIGLLLTFLLRSNPQYMFFWQ